MRLSIIAALVAVALLPLRADAQLYGVRSVPGGQQILYTDTRTGSVTPVATVPTGESPTASAADPDGGRYFLLFTSFLAAVDIRTGAVTQVPLASPYELLQPAVYDPVTSRILGTRDAGPNTQVLTVDLSTGQVEVLLSVPGNSYFDVALDPANRLLFLVDAGSTLRIANVDTGAVSSVTMNQTTSGSVFLAFDSLSNQLLTMGPVFSLVAIDPQTGAVTTIAPVDVAQMVLSGFDFSPWSREVAFVAFSLTPASGLRPHIVVVNVDSGVARFLPPNASLLHFVGKSVVIPTLQNFGLLLLASVLSCVGVLTLSRS